MRGNSICENIYEIITYADSETLNTEVILKFIKVKFPNADLVYILHDKDTLEDGTLKKPHTHILIRFEQVKSINALAKELGIQPNNINWKSDWKLSVQYLIHLNNKEKYQYPYTDVVANTDVTRYLLPRCDKEEWEIKEMEQLHNIMVFISEHTVSLYDVYAYALRNEMWSTYRRNYSIIKDIIK